MRTIRLWYKKFDTAVFTSHLDMNRCFTRAVRRAEIPLWYTEGFNPHPYMTFLMPLPLGQTGLREPIDLKIEDEEITNRELKRRLNSVLPFGLEIVDITKPECKPNEIFAAEYFISIEFDSEFDAEGFCIDAERIMNGGTLMAEKRSKRGTKEVNLCDMVHSFKTKKNGTNAEIITVVAAGNTVNLNADLLINSLLKELSVSVNKTDIVRIRLLKEDMRTFE